MTINDLRDLLVNERIPSKIYISDYHVKIRVDWRYKDMIYSIIKQMLPVGIKLKISGTLMPWECKYPCIVEAIIL